MFDCVLNTTLGEANFSHRLVFDIRASIENLILFLSGPLIKRYLKEQASEYFSNAHTCYLLTGFCRCRSIEEFTETVIIGTKVSIPSQCWYTWLNVKGMSKWLDFGDWSCFFWQKCTKTEN